jgi:DNA-directed RNA polymerase specialized sigma24 family protein
MEAMKPTRMLADLAELCAKETDRFFRGQNYDPRHCFEIFRLAIMERDARAWEAIYSQYGPLVGRWVQKHPGFPVTGEEVQYFVNRAYEKIWAALTPEKFQRFPELGGLLRYLKMCVHSVIQDHNRAREMGEVIAAAEDLPTKTRDQHRTIEDWALDRADRLDFWEMIQARLNDEQERLVVYGAYVLALKPREILEQFGHSFGSVDEVYLVKQNVLARLRRDVELAKQLSGRD